MTPTLAPPVANTTTPAILLPEKEPVSEAAPSQALSPFMLGLMAVTCALCIANTYYAQPLLGAISRDLHVSVQRVGILPTAGQAGFALGVFFLAPLGDVFERRRLILLMLSLLTVALIGAASAPNLETLGIASFAIGITSVISTLVMPFAVSLCGPAERGKTVGTIAGAMLIGILLSRTISGFVGGAYTWRVMYGGAAVMMVVLAFVLRAVLPVNKPKATLPYKALIRSMFDLYRDEPLLRAATVNGFLVYAALSTFWASLVFLLESPTYHLGSATAGLFGLVGAGSALAAPLVGRLADKKDARTLAGRLILALMAGFAILWIFGSAMAGLIAGVILIDIATQSATISNQTSIYTLPKEIHSRLYTVYRTFYSLGGSMGAYLGVYGWSVAGWGGVCAMGMGLLSLALGIHVIQQRRGLGAARID